MQHLCKSDMCCLLFGLANVWLFRFALHQTEFRCSQRRVKVLLAHGSCTILPADCITYSKDLLLVLTLCPAEGFLQAYMTCIAPMD